MIQLAGFLNSSLVNGEGMRSVIFFSGCSLNCPGCHNKDMQAKDYGDAVEIQDILNKLQKNLPIIDGVTISGGDPFEQKESLLELVKELKKQKLNIWVYSGRFYEELLKDPICKEILGIIDVLVDGPFIMSLKTTEMKYIGSSNQRILYLKK